MKHSIKNKETIQDLKSNKIQGVLVEEELFASMVLFLIDNGFSEFQITRQSIKSKAMIDIHIIHKQ